MAVSYLKGIPVLEPEYAPRRGKLKAHTQKTAVELREVIVAGIELIRLCVLAVWLEIFGCALAVISVKKLIQIQIQRTLTSSRMILNFSCC